MYGDPEVHPQPESYWGHVNPIGPRGVYDEAKRYAEALTMAYHRQQGVDTRIARIFNTYGPRMRPHDGRAIPTFLRQALQDKPLTVFGDGVQTRSFCYVEDLIRGLVALMSSEYHQPVNLGNPIEMTLLELAETVIEVTGSRSEIVFEALPQDDPKVRQPGHHARPRGARVGARGRAGRRPAHDDRAVRHRAPDGRSLGTLSASWGSRLPPRCPVREQLSALPAEAYDRHVGRYSAALAASADRVRGRRAADAGARRGLRARRAHGRAC